MRCYNCHAQIDQKDRNCPYCNKPTNRQELNIENLKWVILFVVLFCILSYSSPFLEYIFSFIDETGKLMDIFLTLVVVAMFIIPIILNKKSLKKNYDPETGTIIDFRTEHGGRHKTKYMIIEYNYNGKTYRTVKYLDRNSFYIKEDYLNKEIHVFVKRDDPFTTRIKFTKELKRIQSKHTLILLAIIIGMIMLINLLTIGRLG